MPKRFAESHPGELNSRPAAYKAAALPTELGWRGRAIGPGGKNVCRSLSPGGAGGQSHFWKRGKSLYPPGAASVGNVPELPCPNCGSSLTFVEQYDRNYCYHCGRYAPEGYGDKGAKRCPTCGGILSYIAEYERFYCHHCEAYPPLEAPPDTATSGTGATPESILTSGVAAAPAVAPEAGPSMPAAVHPAEGESAAVEEPTPRADVEASAAGAGENSGQPAVAPQTKPAVLRVKIFSMRKAELVSLCKDYGLESAGTKEQVLDRLLAHLKVLEETQEDTGAAQSESEADTIQEPSPAESAAMPTSTAPIEPAEAPAKRPSDTRAAPRATDVPRAAPAVVAGPVIVTAPTPHAAEPRTSGLATGAMAQAKQEPKADHPCPRCGHELTYISQYRRWYCYSCQRYAPVTRPKFACPTCGGAMRWIERYGRWWCDACAAYAPADLPGPAEGRPRPFDAGASESHARAAADVSVRPTSVRAPSSPSSGIGLVGFGIALYVVFSFFAYFGPMFGVARPTAVSADLLAVLQFLAFLFVALGAIAGLHGLRNRA